MRVGPEDNEKDKTARESMTRNKRESPRIVLQWQEKKGEALREIKAKQRDKKERSSYHKCYRGSQSEKGIS